MKIFNKFLFLMSRLNRVGYSVKKNSLLGKTPKIQNYGPGSIRITHKEFVGQIQNAKSTDQTIPNAQQLYWPLSVTDNDVFPWLSAIAKQYQCWYPVGMVFEYKSISGDIVTNVVPTLGTCIMATDYDTLNYPFVRNGLTTNNAGQDPRNVVKATSSNILNGSVQGAKRIFVDKEYSTSAKPSVSFFHAIECDPSQRQNRVLFCDNTQTVTNGNYPFAYQKTSYQPSIGNDPRSFTLGVTGMLVADIYNLANGSMLTLGELHVAYDIILFKPFLLDPAIVAISPGSISKWSFDDTVVSAHFFGTTTSLYAPSSVTGDVSDGLIEITDNVISIPYNNGQEIYVVIQYNVVGSTTHVLGAAPTVTLSSEIVAYNMFQGDTASSEMIPIPTINSAAVAFSYSFHIVPVVDVWGAATITFSSVGVIPTGTMKTDLIITLSTAPLN